MTPDQVKFTANGTVRISVQAEIFGNWAITESINPTEWTLDRIEWRIETCFCITEIETGARLPFPFRYREIRNARKVAEMLRAEFPKYDTSQNGRLTARLEEIRDEF